MRIRLHLHKPQVYCKATNGLLYEYCIRCGAQRTRPWKQYLALDHPSPMDDLWPPLGAGWV